MGYHLRLVPAGLSNGQNSVRLKLFLFCTHTQTHTLSVNGYRTLHFEVGQCTTKAHPGTK